MSTVQAEKRRWFMPRMGSPSSRVDPNKRMSPVFVTNLVCISAIVMTILIQWFLSCWALGLDFAPIKCLNGTGYLIHKDHPDPADLQRGRFYAYSSYGLAPLLPDGSSVVKIAAALPGDVIVVNAKGISINGRWWGPLNPITMAHTHRTAASVTRTFTVQPGEVLMLGDQPRSYDGRYWGPVKARWIVGHAWRLW